MLRVLRLGITAGLLGALLVVSTTNAAQPKTTITIDIVFGPPTVETFTADGVIGCSGTAVSSDFRGTGANGAATYHLVKTLTCSKGSFQMSVEAGQSPNRNGTIGGFTILGGTGEFANLKGAGSLIATGNPAPGVNLRDVYTGRLTD